MWEKTEVVRHRVLYSTNAGEGSDPRTQAWRVAAAPHGSSRSQLSHTYSWYWSTRGGVICECKCRMTSPLRGEANRYAYGDAMFKVRIINKEWF